MKWKITGQFLFVMFIISITVLFITMAAYSYYFYHGSGESGYYKHGSPENMTINFKGHISFNGEKVDIKPEGIAVLKDIGCWIQVLDENGTEIYNFSKPSDAPSHYTPGMLIYTHKFTGTIEGYTIFGGLYEGSRRQLSYIIGFPQNYVSKFTLVYKPDDLVGLMPQFSMTTFIISFLIVAAVGYIFSARLSKPILGIIDGIKHLSHGDYGKKYPSRGLYKDVYKSLNNLSDTLKSNEAERKKTEEVREEWIANMSHDMKTPIASIKGYAELLSDNEYELSDSEREKYLNIILDKSKYMEGLIEDLKLTYQLKNALLPLKLRSRI